MRLGERGIRFTSKTEGSFEDQETPMEIRGQHRDWLIARGEATEIKWAVRDMKHTAAKSWNVEIDHLYLEFKDDCNACEFKLRFL